MIERLTLDLTHLRICIRNRSHRLEIEASKADGTVLRAPYGQQMIERVAETMNSTVDVRLTEIASGREVYAGRGEHACFETQGDLAAMLSA